MVETTTRSREDRLDASAVAGRIGCVSYLNSKPLIDGIDATADGPVRFNVPSLLLDELLAGHVDIALCSVIDYFRSPEPVEIVPVGGICSRGRTLTVRLFSRRPIHEVREVHADTDSHTSVALLTILLGEMYGIRPTLVPYHAREQVAGHRLVAYPDSVLLIGDKVVTDSPLAIEHPYQLDLGEAWADLTGLPFVFATWLARPGANIEAVANLLDRARRRNASRLDEIVTTHAERHGWPTNLAREYLGELLHFHITDSELAAMARFGELAGRHGLIPKRSDRWGSNSPLRLRR